MTKICICSPYSLYPKADNKPIANATFLDTLTKDLTIGYDRKQREREIKSGIEVDLRVRHIEVQEITSTIQIYGRIKWVLY